MCIAFCVCIVRLQMTCHYVLFIARVAFTHDDVIVPILDYFRNLALYSSGVCSFATTRQEAHVRFLLLFQLFFSTAAISLSRLGTQKVSKKLCPVR